MLIKVENKELEIMAGVFVYLNDGTTECFKDWNDLPVTMKDTFKRIEMECSEVFKDVIL